MNIDSSRHVFSRAWSVWMLRLLRISGRVMQCRVMQYRRPLLCKMVFFGAAFGYKGRPEIDRCLRET
jgi:hypothetical protein